MKSLAGTGLSQVSFMNAQVARDMVLVPTNRTSTRRDIHELMVTDRCSLPKALLSLCRRCVLVIICRLDWLEIDPLRPTTLAGVRCYMAEYRHGKYAPNDVLATGI